MAKPEFVVYIDEAGDEGFKFLPGERGSSRWFVLSAMVVRKSNDAKIVSMVREARVLLNRPEKYVLHFRDIKHEQRIPLVRLIGAAPIKTVSILVHKPSIPNPENFQQEAFSLYRYCTRLLLERVSWLCRDHEKDGNCEAELIFSNRSAMSYDDLRSYLDLLLQQSALATNTIHWPSIASANVRAVNHDQLAGLQAVDAVASSMFFAANKTQYGEVEDRYARVLKSTVYRGKGERVNGYGMKIWCNDAAEIKRLTAIVSH